MHTSTFHKKRKESTPKGLEYFLNLDNSFDRLKLGNLLLVIRSMYKISVNIFNHTIQKLQLNNLSKSREYDENPSIFDFQSNVIYKRQLDRVETVLCATENCKKLQN